MILFLLFLCGIWGGSCKTTATTEPQNVIVELAIYCDVEFGAYFHHNQQQIKEYWAARIWDANLRFKTLPSVNISFRVTSLTAIEDKAKQPFIEENKNQNGQVSMETVLRDFAKWVVTQQKIVPKFDLALLGMGADAHDDTGSGSLAFVGGACDLHTVDGYTGSLLLYIDKNRRWNSCGSLEFGLGTLLNAQRDKTYDSNPSCQDKKYIKSGECSENHFFFSSCSNNAIANFINDPSASCLHRADAPEANVFPAQVLSKQPPSLREQCIQLLNNSNAEVIQLNAKDPCFRTECHLNSSSNGTYFVRYLYPMDNSPCDIEKSCFRGRCISDGFQLINVEAGKCLHSSDPFASNDSLQLVSCPDVPTPLDQFMILEKGQLGLFLATAYSSKDANENSDKCLGLSGKSQIKFEKCSMVEKNVDYGWAIYEQNNFKDKFIVVHIKSNSCLSASTNGNLLMFISNCSHGKPATEWKIMGNNKPPTNLFRQMPTFTSTAATVTTTIRVTTKMVSKSTNVTYADQRKNNSDIEFATTTEQMTLQQQNKLCTKQAGYSLGSLFLVGFMVFLATITPLVILKLKTKFQRIYEEEESILEVHEI